MSAAIANINPTPIAAATTAAPAPSSKISRSARAGLVLRTGGVRREIDTHNFSNVSADAVIALTALDQVIYTNMLHGCSELNKLSKKPKNLSNRLLYLVSQSNPQYKRVLGDWQITGSGIIPDGVLAKVEKKAAKASKRGVPAAAAKASKLKVKAVAPKTKAAPKVKAAKAAPKAAKAVRKVAAPKASKEVAAKKAPAKKSGAVADKKAAKARSTTSA